MADPISCESKNGGVAAVKGVTTDTAKGGFGVWGVCENGHGIHGESTGSRGVVGTSKNGQGVYGSCDAGDGVVGTGRRGVVGDSPTYQGVYGHSVDNAGVAGESEKFDAVYGVSHSIHNAGIFGLNDKGGWGVVGRSDQNTGVSGESATGVGVHGKGGRLAGFFEGDVEVTGDIRLTNADFAEDFDIAGVNLAEPGTVMVLDNDGGLRASSTAYDKRVAGVISGAGSYKPAIVLDKQSSSGIRQPIALMGKVFCKVDAQYGPVEAGDLLTTSPTPGHAMKTADPVQAFGAVIGKALVPLGSGHALIPILVSLQ